MLRPAAVAHHLPIMKSRTEKDNYALLGRRDDAELCATESRRDTKKSKSTSSRSGRKARERRVREKEDAEGEHTRTSVTRTRR